MTDERPPRVPGWLVGWIPARHRDAWVGDLLESWSEERARGRTRLAADAALWWRVVRSGFDLRAASRRLGPGPTLEGRRSARLGGTSDTGGGGMGGGIREDVRLAFRMLRRDAAASGAAFGTLALGVWAFVVGFALVDAVLLEPLGYPEEDRLALVGQGEGALWGIAMADHVELVEESELFEAASVWQGWGILLRPDDGPWTNVSGASVSSGHFEMLGAEPALGRLFAPEDDEPGHTPVVVLAHDAWRERWGGRDVMGEPIDHEGVRYTVVGVVEEGFRDPVPRLLGWPEPELWRASPPSFEELRIDRGQVSFWSLGRLRQGVTAAEASAAVRERLAGTLGASPSEVGLTVRGYGELLAEGSRGSLLLLLGTGVAVLLVSVANLVNLLLARATGRVEEMAVRSALGAGRGRLVRQLVVEGAVLGVVAGGVGVLLAWPTLAPVAGLAAGLMPARTAVELDPTLLLVTFGMAVGSAVVAAGVPAAVATRAANAAGLRSGRRGASRRAPLQSGLVVAQTAVAVVLLTASGLFLRTLWELADEDLGFDADALATAWVGLHPDLFGGDAEQTATLEALLERLAALPGVEEAAGITDLPMSGRVNSTGIVRPDQPEDSELERVQTLVRAVTPGYFETVGVPLLEGRVLTPADAPGAPEVAVVNRRYAERHFPGESPVGRTVVVRGVERRIVGVVDDVTEFSVGAPRDPVLYLTYAQEVQPWMRSGLYAVLRTGGDLVSHSELRSAAADVDPRLPLGTPFRVSDLVDRTTVGYRVRAVLATALGALALLLSGVGLAGVTAYRVGRRTREIGVRVALGADRSRVAATVLGGSGLLTATGVLAGVAGALLLGQVLEGFLFRVPPVDPATTAAAVLALAAVSLAASAVPLRRALRISPVEALREE